MPVRAVRDQDGDRTMHTLSTADHSCTPPRIEIPDPYNAADDLLGRNLVAGRGGKVAYIDDAGSYTLSLIHI